MKKTTVFLITVIVLFGLGSCSNNGKPVQSQTNEKVNIEKVTPTAGCSGDACNFAKLTVKKNSEGHIVSMTVRNLKSEPVKIQVELTNFMGYSQKPWTRFTLGGNESETEAVNSANGFIGAQVKRANVIVD